MDRQIVRQSSSYRQGLVLGLTMAEIMLLLVFCLLIAMAAFFRSEQAKTAEVKEALQAEQTANRSERELVAWIKQHPAMSDLLKGPGGDKDAVAVSRYWRELVDSRTIVEDAKGTGFSTTQIKEGLVLAATLKARGIEPAAALRDSQIIAAMTPKVPEVRDTNVPPFKIPELIQRADASPKAVAGPGGHKWPPIIPLSQAGYSFESGRAELDVKFRASLQNEIPNRILALVKEFEVDVIEVVGHTDEQPLGLRQSNLDHSLLTVLRGTGGIATATPADNAGLGLARAVSVVGVLNQTPQLRGYKILPLSGGQLINNDETLATSGLPTSIQERRRIEIRLRKSTPHDGSLVTATATTGAEQAQPQPSQPLPRSRPLPSPPAVTPPQTQPTWPSFRSPLGSPIY